MSTPRHRDALAIGLWLLGLLLAAIVVMRAHYSADVSALLPRAPTQTQRLLIEQLNQGPVSRLLLVGIDGASPAARAAMSHALAVQLRAVPALSFVANGEAQPADQRFVFDHRYRLSPAVTPQRFSADGLRTALQDTLDQLSSPAGLLLKDLVPQDPTGETLQVLAGLQGSAEPHSQDGVWSSADGSRAVLVARTRAAGSDTDAQEQAIDTIRARFAALQRSIPGAAATRLLLAGAGVFAVQARATIRHEALRMSLLSTALIVLLLLYVYRRVSVLLLGLLPVLSGALAGIAAVALGAGVVYGLTLGFGITLIGESVDYSIYLFIQSRTAAAATAAAAQDWIGSFWPTIRLGMLASLCGFAALLPSGFPGLAQLGLYTICGLAAAAAVTRFVLPRLLPARLALRDLAPLGAALGVGLQWLRRRRALLLCLPVAAVVVLAVHRHALWNRDLAALSPAPAGLSRLDAQLRADLGSSDVRHIVVVSAPAEAAALGGAERAGAVLQELVSAGVIGGFESPARYLPSPATQRQRLDALPDADRLAAALRQATAGLPLSAARLQPFVRAVEAARRSTPLTPADLAGTSMAVGFDALMIHTDGQWRALLPLRAATSTAAIDVARVQRALAQARVPAAALLDLKAESDALYSGYMLEAARLAGIGIAAIAVLLLVTLRSPLRVLRVIAPLALAVLCVAAGCILAGERLGLLHVVGMLLIVAVGSNYALFFDRGCESSDPQARRTLASLLIANAATVTGFGVLAFSTVPVLQALGSTVAPGALLALLFAGLLAPERTCA